jgi:hypothetical protein
VLVLSTGAAWTLGVPAAGPLVVVSADQPWLIARVSAAAEAKTTTDLLSIIAFAPLGGLVSRVLFRA